MGIFLIVAGIIAVALGGFAFANVASDLQIILGSVLCLGGLCLVGLGAIHHKLSKLVSAARDVGAPL